MNEEIEILLNILNKKGLECKKYRIEELVKLTKIPYEKLSSLLIGLQNEGKVYIDKNSLISSFPPHLIFGQIKVNKNINGCITYKGKNYRLKKANKYGILNQDTIIARPTGEFENGIELVAFETIVNRKEGIIVGEVQEKFGEKYIIDINNTIPGKIIIPQKELGKYVNGDRLRIRIGLKRDNDNYLGEVVDMIGHKDDPDLKTKSLLAKFNLPTGFSPEAIQEAKEANRIGITEKHLKGRVDLRRFTNITIDPPTCKDHDDSFFLERLENNHKKVYINIVDVTPWVYPGTAMWKDAEKKDASAYIYGSSEPLLPRPITNGIGSLTEGNDRLAETLAIEFDKNNNIVDFNLFPSIINTKKNCTYEEVNKLLEENIVLPGYENLKEDIIELNQIAEKHFGEMKKRGFLDFQSSDKECVKDENDNTLSLKVKKMGKAEKLVEVFMILADELITNLIYLPAPYRNHEEPDDTIIDEIKNDLAELGIKVKIKPHLDTRIQIKSILKQLEGHPLEQVVSDKIIRKMKRAYYSPDNIGHFGLALLMYLQWTSPDRRFNDLILFHIIKLQRRLETENLTKEEYNKTVKDIYNYLKKMCEKISYTERQIDLAERESIKNIVEENKDKANNLMDAQITYLNSKFILLKTTDGKEGYLDTEKNYRWDQKSRSYIHKKYKFKLQVGNIVKVRIKTAEDNNLTFAISKNEAKKLSLTLK